MPKRAVTEGLWFQEATGVNSQDFQEAEKTSRKSSLSHRSWFPRIEIKVELRPTGLKRTASLCSVKPAGPPLQCQPFAHFPVQIANQDPFRPRWPGTGTDRPGMRRSVPRVSSGSPQRRTPEIHTAVFTDTADYHPPGADAPHCDCRD